MLVMIVGISYLLPNSVQPGQSSGYPPPAQANLVPTEIPYPGPYWVLPNPEPTPTCCWGLPTLGSIDAKSGVTLSPSQIAEVATFAYSKSHIQSYPMPTLPSVSISSLAELPQAIYDMSLSAEDTCIQAKNLGQILPVKSLMAKYSDYYMVPFYENDTPCKVLVVMINDEQATIYSELPFLDKVYPGVSAEEAAKYVTDKTGLQVTDPPILVFRQFSEQFTTQTDPSWQVKTTDGQVYYVFFFTGLFDGQHITTIIHMFNQEELTPIQ